MDIRDEHGNPIDIANIEKPEQDLAKQYIQETDIVFELGARYGSVSCVINSKLNCKTNQIVVEPDERVWEALERNKNANKCGFHIIKGFVSSKKLGLTSTESWHGYGTTSIENDLSNIPSYTMHAIQEQYNLKYNVLVADCEGYLECFFDENPDMYDTLRLIIFEADYPDKCNYKKIRNTLKEKGFTEKLNGHQNVWIKSTLDIVIKSDYYNSINYDKINMFKLTANTYLFFDIFARNNELILICPKYNKKLLYSLQININNIILHDPNIIQAHEDLYVVKYKIYNVNKDGNINVNVKFNGLQKSYILYYKIFNKIYNIVHTTLFKDEDFLINKFIDYHENQGIEHFFIYYNGNLDNIRPMIKDNITYIEWVFPYKDTNNFFTQPSQINHALYKYGKPLSKFLLLTDLDEYIYIPNSTVRQLIVDNPNYEAYIFLNNWCDTIEIPEDINKYRQELNNSKLPLEFYRDTYIFPYGKRSKYLTKTDVLNLNNIHSTIYKHIYINENNVIYHFFRWSPASVMRSERTRESEGFTNYVTFKPT
jgi:FkbM family methyltransferase